MELEDLLRDMGPGGRQLYLASVVDTTLNIPLLFSSLDMIAEEIRNKWHDLMREAEYENFYDEKFEP